MSEPLAELRHNILDDVTHVNDTTKAEYLALVPYLTPTSIVKVWRNIDHGIVGPWWEIRRPDEARLADLIFVDIPLTPGTEVMVVSGDLLGILGLVIRGDRREAPWNSVAPGSVSFQPWGDVPAGAPSVFGMHKTSLFPVVTRLTENTNPQEWLDRLLPLRPGDPVVLVNTEDEERATYLGPSPNGWIAVELSDGEMVYLPGTDVRRP